MADKNTVKELKFLTMASNMMMTIHYNEGDIYEGEWSTEGKRQGVGKLKTSTGDQYIGEFVNGFFHGLGRLVFVDGSKYEGDFESGRYHGYGIYTQADKMKYEGQFMQGSVKGLGLITFSDGSHGQPKQEGKFDGLELIERCSSTIVVQKARQSAADARSIQC